QPGKRADFTVLEQDPFEVPPEDLRDIKIWGTVFGGTPAPLKDN
ncbi:MAG: amidohydrolase family protein, partial [Pseudomonadota bacterium]|nr:amidohydrolase family protein [Pseudomonadota bacterium]